MAQPDPNTIHQALASLTDQAALIPNIPTLNQLQQFAQIQQQLAQIQEQSAQQFAQSAQQFAQVNQQFAQVNQQFAQVNQQFAQVNQRFAQVDQALAQINITVGQIDQRLQNMEDLRSMRIYNASISLDNPLEYPPAIVVVPPFPETKRALQKLTAAHCNVVAGALGLTLLGHGATVEQRRRQISDHLGCAI